MRKTIVSLLFLNFFSINVALSSQDAEMPCRCPKGEHVGHDIENEPIDLGLDANVKWTKKVTAQVTSGSKQACINGAKKQFATQKAKLAHACEAEKGTLKCDNDVENFYERAGAFDIYRRPGAPSSRGTFPGRKYWRCTEIDTCRCEVS